MVRSCAAVVSVVRTSTYSMDRVNPMVREYLSGSLASSFTAGLFNPLEVVKTRLHLQSMPGMRRIYTEGFSSALQTIAREEGTTGLWRHGFVAVVGRDFFYSGVRTGMYPTVRSLIASGRSAEDVGMVQKILAGAICGGVGAGLGNPFDVVRVRMIAEGGLVDLRTNRLLTGIRAGEVARYRSSLECFADARGSEGFVRGSLFCNRHHNHSCLWLTSPDYVLFTFVPRRCQRHTHLDTKIMWCMHVLAFGRTDAARHWAINVASCVANSSPDVDVRSHKGNREAKRPAFGGRGLALCGSGDLWFCRASRMQSSRRAQEQGYERYARC